MVEVNNGLDGEDTAIHWHGLSMRGELPHTEPLALLRSEDMRSEFGMNDVS